MRIRQSLLGSADKCLRALEYDVVGAPDDVRTTGIAREMGTGLHAAAEELYRWAPTWKHSDDHYVRIAQESVEAALEGYDIILWSEAVPNKDTAMRVTEVMVRDYLRGFIPGTEVRRVWDVFEGFDIEPEWEVLGIEHSFDMPAPWLVGPYTGEVNTLSGTADLILAHRKTREIVIVDHKTAGRAWKPNKHHPRKNNQSAWYVAMAKETWPGRPSYRFCFDITVYQKPTKSRPEWGTTFERRISDVRPEHELAVRTKAQEVVRLVDGSIPFGAHLPANPSSDLCSPAYCDHFRYCPFGAALEEGDSAA